MGTRLRLSSKERAKALFMLADREENQGKARSAFRHFLAAAEAGDINAQVRVGYYYDIGRGVRSDRTAALYWYKLAYRRGDPIAAHNIGTIWRDEHNFRLATHWFQRAVDLGSEDSNLNIAKLFLVHDDDPSKAIPYLNRVLQSALSEPDKVEAKALLKRTMRKLKPAN